MPGLSQAPPPNDAPVVDTAEQVYISSLALLKMLKHGRAGVPMEVMGLMLGEFVDDYTVRVIDVFAMPQTGTGVSVEAVDPVFQAKMLDMLKQTGRPEMVVGWYHSHPGFGCWLSGVDINTQQSFEALSERAVAVVVDPIQSVKGKVVIDAFRLINPNMVVLGQEPRQTTSNLGHLQKPSVQALIHGLNRHYYSISINYRKNELEQKMLLNLHKKSWMDGLMLSDYTEHCKLNETTCLDMLDLAKNYNKALEEEEKMTPEQLAIKNVGKQDPKRHLEEKVDTLMTTNIVQCLGAMLDSVVFKRRRKRSQEAGRDVGEEKEKDNEDKLEKLKLKVALQSHAKHYSEPCTVAKPPQSHRLLHIILEIYWSVNISTTSIMSSRESREMQKNILKDFDRLKHIVIQVETSSEDGKRRVTDTFDSVTLVRNEEFD
ncbi:UNVERIFIED_CONTAM: hypothetical protein PYX00_002926 [Menopon gallinae]|uniref:26S proteasome non-ATPase regulatory subunit 14 n=1 Tax=Menopon gallinae TaxID=328185 RepID=A0AAW2HYU7_9NEOP